jgi:hypothetical protein
MPIVPDTKDWTWVLERPCGECGVDASAIDLATLPAAIRALGPAWAGVLGRPGVGVRPDDATWSPLEYACHVRDVLRLYDVRLHLMLDEDGPHYPNWDQDAAAVEGRYGDADPAVVAGELAAAAEQVATSFAAVAPDQWGRTGFRSDGAAFTVASFARYFLHDPLHHLHDVGAPLPLPAR